MAQKISKPDNSDEVLDVMRSYNKKKGFGLSEKKLEYLAEDCFLQHTGQGWAGSRYWPALAMRRVLNYVHEYGKHIKSKPKYKDSRPTLKERLQRLYENEY